MLEPTDTVAWKPGACSLTAALSDDPTSSITLPCLAVPYSATTSSTEGDLVEMGNDVAGSIAVESFSFIELPQTFMRTLATRTYDPAGEFETLTQTLPFGPAILDVLEPSIEAGATAYVGILDIPWESDEYFVPYDAKRRPIPGIWLSRPGEPMRAIPGSNGGISFLGSAIPKT